LDKAGSWIYFIERKSESFFFGGLRLLFTVGCPTTSFTRPDEEMLSIARMASGG
jgi:hypothetical protein